MRKKIRTKIKIQKKSLHPILYINPYNQVNNNDYYLLIFPYIF